MNVSTEKEVIMDSRQRETGNVKRQNSTCGSSIKPSEVRYLLTIHVSRLTIDV
jgi:hypothetical protein